MISKYKILITFLAISFLISLESQAQSKRDLVRSGNRNYNLEKFQEAEDDYTKAVGLDSTYAKAAYNLGNSIYAQASRMETVIRRYDQALRHLQTPEGKAMTLHNRGNALFVHHTNFEDKEEKINWLEKSIESYKDALRIKSDDADTKYNLAMAYRHLRRLQMPEQEQEQNQDQEGDEGEKDDQQEGEEGESQDQQQQQDQQEKQEQEQNQDPNKGEEGEPQQPEEGEEQPPEEQEIAPSTKDENAAAEKKYLSAQEVAELMKIIEEEELRVIREKIKKEGEGSTTSENDW